MSIEEKSLLLLQGLFLVWRIRLIWLDIIVEQVNRKEKSYASWTNRHILEQMNREEQKTKLSVSCLVTKSLWLVNVDFFVLIFH